MHAWLLAPDNFTPPSRTPWGGAAIVSRYKRDLGLDPGTRRSDDPVVAGPASKVLAALRREPASADVLAARCGLSSATAAALIVELELAGLIVREIDGRLVPAP
jgi:predicted Rossmann fold nucleotide-binding protein DprA/Smf involved in DNA uptake